MCDPVSATMAVLGAYSISQQRQQASQAADAQAQASEKATAAATKQADLADVANNKANAKSPDVNSLMSANTAAAKGAGGSTMLTGPLGVDPKTLLLGKTTLLGG